MKNIRGILNNLIAINLLLVLLFGCSEMNKNDSKSLNGSDFLPKIIYSDAKDLHYIKSGIKNTKMYICYTKLKYPSKKVFNFFNMKLKEFEFIIQKTSLGYDYKFGKWEVSYSSEDPEKTTHANLNGIWINPKKKQIAWLHLFYDWTNVSWRDRQNVMFSISQLNENYSKYKDRVLEFYNLGKKK